MDKIEKISELGVRFGVPVHVDASIGGFLLPFMEQCKSIKVKIFPILQKCL